MNLLGSESKGFVASEHDHTLPDGRVVGPFESDYARSQFAWWFDKKAHRLFSAKELYEGVVGGDDYRLVSGDEVALETHPFREIVDIWLSDDNGKVVFEMDRGFAVVDPRRLVLVDEPMPYDRRATLSPPLSAPVKFDLKGAIDHRVPAQRDGEIIVVDTGEHTGADYLVAWRLDGRVKKDIVGLSRHSHASVAVKEAEKFARDFLPPYGPRKNRPKDEQRQRLYLWEHSFGTQHRHFEDLYQAQELASGICADLGIRGVLVKAGRKDLSNHSYYKSDRIVLAADMVDNHTVVHEVAHHVVNCMKGTRETAHGPRFAGVLLALLVRYMGADEVEALEKASDRDIIVDKDVLRALAKRLASTPEPGPKI